MPMIKIGGRRLDDLDDEPVASLTDRGWDGWMLTAASHYRADFSRCQRRPPSNSPAGPAGTDRFTHLISFLNWNALDPDEPHVTGIDNYRSAVTGADALVDLEGMLIHSQTPGLRGEQRDHGAQCAALATCLIGTVVNSDAMQTQRANAPLPASARERALHLSRAEQPAHPSTGWTPPNRKDVTVAARTSDRNATTCPPSRSLRHRRT